MSGDVSVEDLAETCARALTRPPSPGRTLAFEVRNGAPSSSAPNWKAMFASLKRRSTHRNHRTRARHERTPSPLQSTSILSFFFLHAHARVPTLFPAAPSRRPRRSLPPARGSRVQRRQRR